MEMKSKKDDKNDLEEIILKYWPQINFRVRRSLGHFNSDWEDVASEILLNVIEALEKKKFRGESSLGTFIYKITSRRIIDYIRNKNRKTKHLQELDKLSDPHQHVEKKEQAEMFSECIKKLKPRHADMLYLYYYMGVSQSEIAQTFGISPSRVSQLLNNATEFLKRIIIS